MKVLIAKSAWVLSKHTLEIDRSVLGNGDVLLAKLAV